MVSGTPKQSEARYGASIALHLLNVERGKHYFCRLRRPDGAEIERCRSSAPSNYLGDGNNHRPPER